MLSWIMVLGLFGYGVGYEGCENGKYRFGVYTPSAEYGWVVTNREIYLDTVFSKDCP